MAVGLLHPRRSDKLIRTLATVPDTSFAQLRTDMRYAVIIAGGSGTRLWPMSRTALPKQLIPFIGGRCLLEIAVERLAGLLPPQQCFVLRRTIPCRGDGSGVAAVGAGPIHRRTLRTRYAQRGRPDAAVLARHDPEATLGVFTADHMIEPAERFRAIVDAGFAVVERHPETLLTFGIAPTGPATGYGYLELGETFDGSARRLRQFREKPDLETAKRYVEAGPERFLWNSGMFVWRPPPCWIAFDAMRRRIMRA